MPSKGLTDRIRVLLVDDEKVFLKMTSQALVELGCEVAVASSGEEAMTQLESAYFDVLVLDVRMPGMDGIAVLRKLEKERPTQQVVMLTGQATLSTAIEAMKLGAYDFLLKPCKIDDLNRVIQNAAERGRLERRNIALEGDLQRTVGPGEIVGESTQIKGIHEFIRRAALSDIPVLITGESGTGKELVARAIHRQSGRVNHSLVVVDGSTLRAELLASELFGHEKGAFTGAVRKKAGLFEVADRGSVFLDEIGEISTANQAALLRVIEYGTFRPLGAVNEVHTNVRIITATNKDIKKAVECGEFREDLYYRLNGLSIILPSLREFKSDIPIIAGYYLDRWNAARGSGVTISQKANKALESYDWPGNVRELRYVMELAALQALSQGVIELNHLPEEVRKPGSLISPETQTSGELPSELPVWEIPIRGDDLSLEEFRDTCERDYIKRLLTRFNDNKSKVARVLGISRSMLYERLRLLGIR